AHVDPQTGQQSVRLTRDGRLMVAGDGTLTNAAGHKLLDPNDQPIRLDPGVAVTVTADGRLLQNNAEAGRLQLAVVENPGGLEKIGGNLFAFTGSDPRNPDPAVQPVLHV